MSQTQGNNYNEETRRRRENSTYTDVTKKGVTKQNAIPIHQSSKSEYRTMYICVLHAHFHNAGNPGEYGSELNKMHKVNNFHEVKIPNNNRTSAVILGNLHKTTTSTIPSAANTPETGTIPKAKETN